MIFLISHPPFCILEICYHILYSFRTFITVLQIDMREKLHSLWTDNRSIIKHNLASSRFFFQKQRIPYTNCLEYFILEIFYKT